MIYKQLQEKINYFTYNTTILKNYKKPMVLFFDNTRNTCNYSILQSL